MSEGQDGSSAGDVSPRAGATSAAVQLRPRWLWITFAAIAVAIPLLGFLLEKG